MKINLSISNMTLPEFKEYLKYILENEFNGNMGKLIVNISCVKSVKTKLNEFTPFLNNLVNWNNKPIKVNSSLRLYCILNDIIDYESYPKCSICGKIKAFKTFTEGFYLSCGNRKCYQKLEEVNQKRQSTAIDNYGDLKKAYHDTAMETYKEQTGYDNPSHNSEVIEKKEFNNLEKFGARYSWMTDEGKEYRDKQIFDKYGVDNISQTQEIVDKKLETTGREYITPNGNKVLIEGYEDKALDFLLKEVNINENDLIIHSNIKIDYKDNNEKIHYWFPDFYIKSSNTLIECRSFELMLIKNDICNKFKHAIEQSYNCQMLSFYNEHVIILEPYDMETRYFNIYYKGGEFKLPTYIIRKLMENNYNINLTTDWRSIWKN